MYLGIRGDTGSILDGVFAIFDWNNPFVRTMELGSTDTLTEMSTRNISWRVKAAGVWRWQTYHLYVPIVNLLEPLGSVQACTEIALQHVLKATRIHADYRYTLSYFCCWLAYLQIEFIFVIYWYGLP